MRRVGLHNSVITRLVLSLLAGGLLLSVGLSVLELRRSESILQIEITQQAIVHTRNMQTVIRELVGQRSEGDVAAALSRFATDERIRATRLSGSGFGPLELGDWGLVEEKQPVIWALAEHSVGTGRVSMHEPTLVQAYFHVGGETMMLDVLIDGPAAFYQMRSRVIKTLAIQWMLLAVTTLLGLLLIRRWFAGPLSEIVQRVSENAGPEPFYGLSQELRGEFAQLAEAIAGMLTRLRSTADQLRSRERAFENLYQFAPAAMISVDPQGVITEANLRAGQMICDSTQHKLIGRAVLDLIKPEDHAKLRQGVDRLELDEEVSTELRLATTARGDVDVLVEATGVRDEDGGLCSVRLSLQDVTQIKQLQRLLSEKSRLMNLVIDHMSDAILLVDERGRIAAHNQQLANLLHLPSEVINGQRYEVDTFWDALGVRDLKLFAQRLRQIESDDQRPAQERVETRVGVFQFQGIPVHDDNREMVGRLWVVQEVTPLEQSQRLLNQQTRQLLALKQLTRQLSDVTSINELFTRTAQILYDAFGIDAVGLAIRSESEGDPNRRSRQIIHQGDRPQRLEHGRQLVQTVENELMSRVLAQGEVTLWEELSGKQNWAAAFAQAGLTGLAAVPVTGSGDAQGILWIARKSGERIERQHVHLLETFAPIIAARLEVVQLLERLADLALTDPVTQLPNRRHYELAVQQRSRTGRSWAAIVVRVETGDPSFPHGPRQRETLKKLAEALSHSLRRNSFLARLHGATFAAVCPDTDHEIARHVSDRLRSLAMKEASSLLDRDDVKVRAGVACHDEHVQAIEVIALAEERVDQRQRPLRVASDTTQSNENSASSKSGSEKRSRSSTRRVKKQAG